MNTWCNLKYDDKTIQNAIYVDGDKTKSKKIYEKKKPANGLKITYTISIDYQPSTDNGSCMFIFTGIDQKGNFIDDERKRFQFLSNFTNYLNTNFKEKKEAITAVEEAAVDVLNASKEAEAAEATIAAAVDVLNASKEAERVENERKAAAEAIKAAEAAEKERKAEAIKAAEKERKAAEKEKKAAEAAEPTIITATEATITAASEALKSSKEAEAAEKERKAALFKSRNPDKMIYFYGNYEPDGANNELSNPVDLASVLKLQIAKGNWIHYNYLSKENPGNRLRTVQITKKYPYLHLTLTQTLSDGKWTVSGYIKTSGIGITRITEGEFPPKKEGRVGGSKMGRSTVLGRIMSIIRGSIKHVTRKKGRKPRSKTRRYKNKSQKKEKNKLNITKKVRFNRNKI
jgi:chemotaxis protein histidine kinase CheA